MVVLKEWTWNIKWKLTGFIVFRNMVTKFPFNTSRCACCDQGLVHPKNENEVINYSPPSCTNPVRPSFIFGTQMKIFLIKFERLITAT